jgi:hypothetical protein
MVVFGIEKVFFRFEHASEGAGAPSATLAKYAAQKTTPAQSRKRREPSEFLMAILLIDSN